MNEVQSEALSRVFAEMATKRDLAEVEGRLRADLTWRMIAVVGFFATAATILKFFVA